MSNRGAGFTYRSFPCCVALFVDECNDGAEDWRRETCAEEG